MYKHKTITIEALVLWQFLARQRDVRFVGLNIAPGEVIALNILSNSIIAVKIASNHIDERGRYDDK